jgi:uncharacterized protein (DUF1778 family)
MSRKDPQLNLRLPADLKDMLEEAASKSNRSVTAETVDRLQASFTFATLTSQALFVMSRTELRAAEAEAEMSRFYAVGIGLFDALQKLKKANETGNADDLKAEFETLMESSELSRIIKLAESGLYTKQGRLSLSDATSLMLKAYEKKETQKEKTDELYKELTGDKEKE